MRSLALRRDRRQPGALAGGIPKKKAARGALMLFHIISIHLLVICDILYTSRLHRITVPIAQTGLLGAISILVLIYVGICILRGFLIPLLTVSLLFFLIAHQVSTFATFTGAPMLINIGFQFVPILSVVVFYAVCKDGLADYLMQVVLRYGLIYCGLYLALAILYALNLVPHSILAPLISNDVERGDRLFLYMAPSSLVWFASLQRVRQEITWRTLGMLLVSGLAIAIALSRVYALFMFLVTAMYLGGVGDRILKWVCLSILATASAVYFYSMLDARWNPFALFSNDSSGSARTAEFETARYFIQQSPIWGIGIPPTTRDIGLLTGNEYFAPSDLGAMGVWYDWGLLGLLTFFVGCYLICRPMTSLTPKFRRPALLTACVMAGYGCVAPVILYPAAETYFALFLGVVLAEFTGLRRTGATETRPSRWKMSLGQTKGASATPTTATKLRAEARPDASSQGWRSS